MGAIDPNLRVALLKGMIPAETLRELDAEELHDRLVKALELLAKSDAADSPALRKAFGAMAADVLGAQPRAKTEAEVTQWLRKASKAPTRDEATHARAQAQRIQKANPIAPRQQDARQPVKASTTMHLGPASVWTEVYDRSGRRLGRAPSASIRKAKNDKPLMVVFDESGNIVGLVDPEKLQPVGNQAANPQTAAAPAPKAAPAAQPGSEVAKSHRGAPSAANRYGGRR